MSAIGFLAQAVFGTASTVVDGLPCTQTTVASMQVQVGLGSIISLSTADATAFGSLASDSSALVKIGINNTTTLFTLTAPGVSGQSINYLIQGALQESDTTPIPLPYYNSANPATPYSGPSNSGAAQNTQRIQRVNLQLKAGTAATTGTQVTPSADSGFTSLYYITVAFGASSVTNGNIFTIPNAPFAPIKLQNQRSGFSNIAVFSSSGNWTVPNFTTTAEVELWAAGGAGGAAVGTNQAGSGGGGGTYAHKLITGLTPGTTVAVTVGAGGVGNTVGTGSNGGTSSFGGFLSATGGTGGLGDLGAPGHGGSASGADFAIVGGTGLAGLSVTATFAIGGSGGNSPRGGFGGPQGVNAAGNAGQIPGGAGAGAGTSTSTPFAGGDGAPGMVIVRW